MSNPSWDDVWAHLSACGKVDSLAMDRATRLSAESGDHIARVLTRLGILSEPDLAAAVAIISGLPLVSVADFQSIAVLDNRLSPHFLRECLAIPLEFTPEGLAVAVADPFAECTTQALAFVSGTAVLPRIACPSDIEAAIAKLYASPAGNAPSAGGGVLADEADDIDRLKDIASEAPVIRLVSQLVNRAVEARASDIHLEPMDGEMRVRYRVDGVLREVESLPLHLRAAVISRIKILAKLNIAERRLAQDGRIRLVVRGKQVDVRVSTTPTIFGESVVLRILDRGNLALDFLELGFDDEALAAFSHVTDRPHGIVLVTGPTGSGKTTTLYTALLALNTPDKKILTVEDPVEYQLRGINQVQVKPQIGLTFASALRSFLRQDPDVMLIGEIRDIETAQIAAQAALTGHLILSTLHTNDAASAVTRLLDMGVEDYLLTSTLSGLVSQRLVRRLCRTCHQPYELLPEAVERLQIPVPSEGSVVKVWKAGGCPECGWSGYCGRTSIIEVLPVTDAIRQLILRRAEAGLIRQAAIEGGMRSMYAHGMTKVVAGETSIEEILRVTREI